ncbi:MAG: HEAT repeat domain-containing protein [Thermogutta sp.]
MITRLLASAFDKKAFVVSAICILLAGSIPLGCRPMPPMGENSARKSRGRQRTVEFREVRYTDKTPEEWLSLLGHHNSQVRDQAIDALLQYGPEQVKPLISVAADRSNPRARLSAIRALGAFGTKAADAVPVLIQALEDDAWDGRDAAAEALGMTRQDTPEVMTALVQALEDQDERIRMAAARALGRCKFGNPTAIQALTKVLGDSDTNVQLAAIEALGEIGPAAKSALPQLQKLAETAPPLVASSAREAMRRVNQNQ